MASLIRGYEYDIFISYRQKDNKGDKWVTKFVEALKTELDATFKEDISIYFDENPHDRLQETHDVDKSLEGKLKCLIFIPILSQTYCDPNSYAWQYEFITFNKFAREDRFGRDIRLRSGNYASRILPIRIHDLEQEDIKLFERETGGVLRAMDFVFKTAGGVNRPLKPNEDHPQDNLNKTYYGDQINKTANAIKEIASSLKTDPVISHPEIDGRNEKAEAFVREELKSEKKNLIPIRKIFSSAIILAVIIIATILVYSEIVNKNSIERLKSSGERISVAVMPFQNLTNDTIWNVWQYGIQNEIITYLTNFSKELKVKQIESVNSLLNRSGDINYASLNPDMASKISQKLDASICIYGTIKKAGSTLRLNAQFIDSKSKDVINSIQVETSANEKTTLQIIDSLNLLVGNYLIISRHENEMPAEFRQATKYIKNAEAFKYTLLGNNAYWQDHYSEAVKWFNRAIEIDSNLAVPTGLFLANAYGWLYKYDDARKWTMYVYQRRENLYFVARLQAEWLYGEYIERDQHNQAEKFIQMIEFDDQMPLYHWMLGLTYTTLNQYNEAIPELEKALAIYDKWGVKPIKPLCYTNLGGSYHKTGQIEKEKKIYEKCEVDFPGDPDLLFNQALLSFSVGDSLKAMSFIEKYTSASQKASLSETTILTRLGELFTEAGLPEKAEASYRKAVLLDPQSSDMAGNLAFFLIDSNRDPEEGMRIVEKALRMHPDHYACLYTKGWGLYKSGRYKEALELIQRGWDLRPRYDHRMYLNLVLAKKAIEDKS